MAKHIGIVVCSAEVAAVCYRRICAGAARQMGEHMHPEVSMHTYPLSDYMVHIRAGDWKEVGELMLSRVYGDSRGSRSKRLPVTKLGFYAPASTGSFENGSWHRLTMHSSQRHLLYSGNVIVPRGIV